jgi:hypothetical protein
MKNMKMKNKSIDEFCGFTLTHSFLFIKRINRRRKKSLFFYHTAEHTRVIRQSLKQ